MASPNFGRTWMNRGETPDLDRLRVTRRRLLRDGSLVALTAGSTASFLAACSSGSDSDGEASSAGAVGGALSMLSWEGYDLLTEPAMTKWRKANDVRVRSTYISSQDDVQAKLRSGATVPYDLTTYYQGYVSLYRQLDILADIDETKLPNLSGLYPEFGRGEFSDQFWKIDGTRYGVPWTWGAGTCDYRADRMDAPESWSDLLDPELKGKVGWASDANASYCVAGRALGLTPPNFTEDQFQQTSDFLRQIRRQVRNYAPSYGDIVNQMASGDVIVTFAGWAALSSLAKPQGIEVKSVVPKEGTYSFCDAYAIPRTAKNTATALAFMNESLSARVQAQQAAANSAGVVTPAALPHMSEETRALYPYDRLEELLQNAPFYGLPPFAAQVEDSGVVPYERWIEEWTKIKAGQ